MVSRSSGKRSTKRSTKPSAKGSKADSSLKGKGTAKGIAKGKKSKGKIGTAVVGEGDEVAKALSPREMLVLQREATAKRKEIVSFVAAVVAGCFLLGLLISLLVNPKLGVSAGGALMCLVMSFKYQRLALYAFIIYIPFAGTVTYAVGGNPILQVAKDIFYIPALIGVYQFCRKNRLPIILPKAIRPPLIFLLIVVILTALLTNVPDQVTQTGGRWPIVMAIWGAKLLFGYVPLVACIYYLIRNKEDLVGLLRLQAVLVLVACSLGFVQYFMLKTGMCQGTAGVGQELFRASLDARCFVGGSLLYSPDVGQIRLPGTFVAPWQWGWFLISAAFFSFGTTFSDKSAFWRATGLVSLVAVMVMAVVSGQRIALVLVPSAIILLTVMTGQVTNLKRFLPIGLVLGLILTYLVTTNPTIITGRIESLQSRWSASPPQAFIAEQFGQVWREQEGIFGHGIGRATNSARTFGSTTLIETYHPKLIYEIGPIGLLAALAVYTALTVATFRVYRKTKDKNLRSYAASMWVFILFISYCPYYYPLDVDPVGVYYWLAAGIVLKIPELERQEAAKRAALAAPEQPVVTKKAGRRRESREVPTFE
ncbi:MAG: hormogonium polysaccharide biosynthesis protein HpsL [Phormidesmis sp.]